MTTANILSQLGSAGVSTGFKNRIINGAMVIDQRNAGASSTASVTNAVTYVTCDRWAYVASQASKFTIQQNAGSVTTPAGFTNYLGITSSSAYTVSSSDFFLLRYNIEGFNTSDLAFGTANAKTITLSFLVYSSLTGTFGGAIGNSANTRTYPFSYTVSVANTWTQISITIPGDTTGTWVGATNGIGLKASWSLGTGSTSSGTAGSWAGSEYYSSTGATSVVGTNGATFYITGVQLEVGTTATNFEYRSYGTELALCQRYYEKSYNIDVALGTATNAGLVAASGVQGAVSTGECDATATFKVTKRASPTMAYWDNAGNSGKCVRVQLGVSTTANSLIQDNFNGANGFVVYSSSGVTASAIWLHFSATAEL